MDDNYLDDKENEALEKVEDAVSNFELVKLEDFPKEYIIKKEEDLQETLSIFENEIKSFIDLKNINVILSDKKYSTKVLNKKIEDYSNLKSLFLYFSLEKKAKNKGKSMNKNFISNDGESKSETKNINQDINKIDNNANTEKKPKEDKKDKETEEEDKSINNKKKIIESEIEKMKKENKKQNEEIKDETQENKLSNGNIVKKKEIEEDNKNNIIINQNNNIINQNETEDIKNKNEITMTDIQSEKWEQNDNDNKNKNVIKNNDKELDKKNLIKNIEDKNEKPKFKQTEKVKEIEFQIKNSRNSKYSIRSKDNSETYSYSNISPNQIIKNNQNSDDAFLESNILTKLIEKEDEIIEGKDYEIKVKKYFKIYLDYCSSQDLNIESNPSNSFNFLYNLAKDHKKVFDGPSSENVVEFDVLVKNIKIEAINNLIETFKTSIIAYNLKSLENINNQNFDIIGEAAIDILNQSVAKKKQIRKYIDIILIDRKLRQKNEMKKKLAQNYKTLNLGVENDKILMIFSNGSYIKLKYGVNHRKDINETKFFKNNKIYRNKDIKNIKYFVTILDLLEEHKIPYIIFYIGNDLTNNIDNMLVNYIKINEKQKKILDQIVENEKETQKNLIGSYYINSITEIIKEANINLFKNIISYLPDETHFETVINDIYSSIIDIKLYNNFKVQYIIVLEKKNIIKNQKNLLKIMNNKLSYISYNENIYITKDQIQNTLKEIPTNKNHFIFLLYDESNATNDLSFIIENDVNSFDLNYFKVNLGIKNIIKEKFTIFVYTKIYNYVLKNINNYLNDKEYLCSKNMLNKIIYDLKNMNFIFYPKDIKTSELEEIQNDLSNSIKEIIRSFNNYTELKNSNVIYNTLEDALKNEGKISNIILKNVKESDEALDKLYEHYSCLKLYYYLFSSKMINSFKKLLGSIN